MPKKVLPTIIIFNYKFNCINLPQIILPPKQLAQILFFFSYIRTIIEH